MRKTALRLLLVWLVLAVGILRDVFLLKRYYQFVQICLWILRPQLATLEKVGDHIVIFIVLLALITVLNTKMFKLDLQILKRIFLIENRLFKLLKNSLSYDIIKQLHIFFSVFFFQ